MACVPPSERGDGSAARPRGHAACSARPAAWTPSPAASLSSRRLDAASCDRAQRTQRSRKPACLAGAQAPRQAAVGSRPAGRGAPEAGSSRPASCRGAIPSPRRSAGAAGSASGWEAGDHDRTGRKPASASQMPISTSLLLARRGLPGSRCRAGTGRARATEASAEDGPVPRHQSSKTLHLKKMERRRSSCCRPLFASVCQRLARRAKASTAAPFPSSLQTGVVFFPGPPRMTLRCSAALRRSARTHLRSSVTPPPCVLGGQDRAKRVRQQEELLR